MNISGRKTRAIFDHYHIISTDDLHRTMRRVQAAALELPEGNLKEILPESTNETK